ncbi:MAG TPA: hypothetical protein VF832_19815, partial [Longimicrobiales bacterium]
MTSDEFHGRYRLLDQVAGGPVRTFHAVASTGAIVMAHFLEGGPAQADRRLHLVSELGPPGKGKVLDVLIVDDVPVVIGRFVMDFVTFDRWLEDELAAQRRTTAPQPASPAPAAHEPGEFTRLFAAAPQAGLPPAAAPAGPPPAPRAQAAAPGEFTRLFASPAAEPAAPPPPAPPPAAAPAPPAESGEFTRLFAAPAAEPAAAPSFAPVGAEAGGDRYFER